MKKTSVLLCGLLGLGIFLTGCGTSSLDSVVKNAANDAVGVTDNTSSGDALLGYSDTNGDVVVKLALPSNFTAESAMVATSQFMGDVFKDSRVQQAEIVWEIPMTDAYGNITDKVVGKIQFTRQTAEKVHWDTVPPSGIPKIADSFSMSPDVLARN